MAVVNIIAYYDITTITAIIGFMEQSPKASIIKLFTAVINSVQLVSQSACHCQSLSHWSIFTAKGWSPLRESTLIEGS